MFFVKKKFNLIPAIVFSFAFHAGLALLLIFSSSGVRQQADMAQKKIVWVSWEQKTGAAPAGSVSPFAKKKSEPAQINNETAVKREILLTKAAHGVLPDFPGAAPANDYRVVMIAGSQLANAATATDVTQKGDSFGSAVGTADPSYREKTPPVYPSLARLRGYEGEVLVATEILPNGNVGNLKIKKSSGYAILDEAAAAAVKNWKFEPARKMGKPCAAWRDHVIKFFLQDDNNQS